MTTTFHTTRLLCAPPAAVFAAIEDPARLARWWGPEGFTNTFHHFDFRPGGAWRFDMHAPHGATYPNASEFAEIVPGALVRIRHVSPPHFVLSISLAPAEGGGTLLGWAQQFDDPQVAEGLRAVVVPANEQNLDRLARELAGGGRCPA